MSFFHFYMRIEFLIELVAAELLFATNFKIKKYRSQKLGLLIFILGVAACIPIMYYVQFSIYYLNTIKFLSVFFVTCVLIYFSWDIKFGQIAFIGICAYSMQHIGYSINTIMFSVLSQIDGLSRFLWQHRWLRFLINIVIFIIVYFILYVIFVRKFRKEQEHYTNTRRQTLVAFIVLLTTAVLNLIEGQFGRGMHISISIGCRIYAIVCCLFSIMIQQDVFQKSKLEQDKVILDQLLRSEYKHQQITKENMDFINIKCHDLKKQISGLRKINDDEAKNASVTEIEKAVTFIEASAKTGNESLDIILMEKSIFCDNNDIKFSYIVDGTSLSFMSSIDIYSLFSNALDNAQESVSKIFDKEKRIISLKSYTKDKMYFIEVENCYEGVIKYENGIPATKDDKTWHGYGVKSIKFIVNKYGGNVLFSSNISVFRLQILIPLI